MAALHVDVLVQPSAAASEGLGKTLLWPNPGELLPARSGNAVVQLCTGERAHPLLFSGREGTGAAQSSRGDKGDRLAGDERIFLVNSWSGLRIHFPLHFTLRKV